MLIRSGASSERGTRVITTLIKGTDFTKNKSTVLDPVGTEGVWWMKFQLMIITRRINIWS